MRTHKLRAPLLSIATVAVAGAVLWLVNVATEPPPGAAVVSVPAPVVSTTAPAPVSRFPTAAQYSGEISTAGAPIVVDLWVVGDTVRAYACDGYRIETWLSGTATGDEVSLISTDRSSRLDGRLEDRTVNGTFTLGERSWQFSAPAVTDAR